MSPNTLSPAEEQMECGSKRWKWRESSWRWGGRDRELAVRSQSTVPRLLLGESCALPLAGNWRQVCVCLSDLGT